MQVSNYPVDQHISMSVQLMADGKGNSNSLRRQERLSDSKAVLLPDERRLNAYRETKNLRRLQEDHHRTQVADSYLEKLQRVLERFKEVNREIVKEAVFNEKKVHVQNKKLLQELNKVKKEFPDLEAVTTKLGNLEVQSYIGLDHSQNSHDLPISHENPGISHRINQMLAGLDGERQTLSHELEGLEQAVLFQGSTMSSGHHQFEEVFNTVTGGKAPSNVHTFLKSEAAIELLS